MSPPLISTLLVVYQHEDRFINVFVWPAASRAIDFDVQSHQGYSLCGWNKSGFNYLIISGLSEAEMEKLEDLLRAQVDSSGPLNDVGPNGISEYRLCVSIICRRAQKSEMELLSRLPPSNAGAEATKYQPHTKEG